MNDSQAAYWNREGATKTFTHPVNLAWLKDRLRPGAKILDYGCGYGRVTALLADQGYDVVGVDFAQAMIEKSIRLYPSLPFQQIASPRTPFPDEHFDAAVLFAVLTCIPSDKDQRATIGELERVVRPGGLLYVSDYWLATDPASRERYRRGAETYRTYGVFEVSEGVAVRHHCRRWIAELLQHWELIVTTDIEVTTMNGHRRPAFQWLGRKGLKRQARR